MQLTPEQQEEVRQLKLYLNETPELLSLLYDIDLLPEQLEDGSREWFHMILIIEAWKNRKQF